MVLGACGEKSYHALLETGQKVNSLLVMIANPGNIKCNDSFITIDPNVADKSNPQSTQECLDSLASQSAVIVDPLIHLVFKAEDWRSQKLFTGYINLLALTKLAGSGFMDPTIYNKRISQITRERSLVFNNSKTKMKETRLEDDLEFYPLWEECMIAKLRNSFPRDLQWKEKKN